MKSADFDLKEIIKNHEYQSSPEAWEEQILYFLLIDRFADGKDRALYDPEKDFENVLENQEALKKWKNQAENWNGGNLQGLINRLDYLQDMGVTAIWISPVLKQAPFASTYHGYGIQNFLAVDPHFGSKEDLRKLCQEAHKRDMYIILDVIINHAGDIFSYEADDPVYREEVYPIKGFKDGEGNPTVNPQKPDRENAWPDGGVWPRELFNLETFTRKGYIQDWDKYPEYIEGDFFSLKNIKTGQGELEDYRASEALEVLVKCYKYWIAYADIDGFRLDTVKHLHPGATRYFVTEIREFAHTLGKKNFYIIGEITGGMSFAKEICDSTGLNAALGINKIPQNLENVTKGYASAEDYFSIFKNTKISSENEHKWFRNNVITMFDDHDMVYQQSHKERFSADKKTSSLLKNAIFLNLFSLGIPCVYYGTEQAFDGSGDHDKYVREAMFGGSFGAFRSQGKSFFNKDHPVYQEISKLSRLRQNHDTLKMGRQYLRRISPINDNKFSNPKKPEDERYKGIITWSRIFSQKEFLLAINCNLDSNITVKVMIDSDLNDPGAKFKCLYSSDKDQINTTTEIIEIDEENYYITIMVPARGRTIFTEISEQIK